jgi:hypothetical protein
MLSRLAVLLLLWPLFTPQGICPCDLVGIPCPADAYPDPGTTGDDHDECLCSAARQTTDPGASKVSAAGPLTVSGVVVSLPFLVPPSPQHPVVAAEPIAHPGGSPLYLTLRALLI